MRALTFGAALLSLTVGCGGLEEQVSPLSTTTTETGTTLDAGAGGSGGAAPDAGVVKRTMMKRNPFGNVAEAENLLWDGDFEWLSPFSDQYGWLFGNSPAQLGYALPDVEIGAACRSGIKCARLKKNRVLAGIAVSARDSKMEVSFWSHLTKGTCDQVTTLLVDFDQGNDPEVEITPVSVDPDFTGWCQYSAVVGPWKGKPVLYIENDTASDILVDDAVIKKVPAARSLHAWHGPLTAELSARAADTRASLLRLRGPHDAPPGAARRAFEQRKGTAGGDR